MPGAGELVERTANDLADPAEHEPAGLRVVGARDRRRQTGAATAGLRRALVEVEVVPGRRPGRQLTAELPVLEVDRRGRVLLLGPGVTFLGGDAELDRGEAARFGDPADDCVPGRIEGRLRVGLEAPRNQ